MDFRVVMPMFFEIPVFFYSPCSHIHYNRLLRLVQYISRYLDIYTPLTLERKLGSAVLMWHNTVRRGARGLLGEPGCRHSSYMLHKQVNIAPAPVSSRY